MRTLLFIICIAGLSSTQGQVINREFTNGAGQTYLLGEVELKSLNAKSYKSWYKESFMEYEVNKQALSSVELPDSITIFMGTWCGDSKREVPRFVKILEQLNYDKDKLKIVCLNRGFQNYKQSPEGEERGVNVHRVPTFIFHDAQRDEINRIVESPVVSLEEDIAALVQGKYDPNYRVVSNLIKKFGSNDPVTSTSINASVDDYRSMVANVYELNTYGYVLLTSFQLKKAELVFELNQKLFPEEPLPHQSMARLMEMMGENEKAIDCLSKALVLDPENEDVQERLDQLQRS